MEEFTSFNGSMSDVINNIHQKIIRSQMQVMLHHNILLSGDFFFLDCPTENKEFKYNQPQLPSKVLVNDNFTKFIFILEHIQGTIGKLGTLFKGDFEIHVTLRDDYTIREIIFYLASQEEYPEEFYGHVTQELRKDRPKNAYNLNRNVDGDYQLEKNGMGELTKAYR